MEPRDRSAPGLHQARNALSRGQLGVDPWVGHQACAAPADGATGSYFYPYPALVDTAVSLTSSNNLLRQEGKETGHGKLPMGSSGFFSPRFEMMLKAPLHKEGICTQQEEGICTKLSAEAKHQGNGVRLRGDAVGLESRLVFPHLSRGGDR